MLIIFDLDGPLVKASWKKLFEAYKKLIAADGKNWKDFFRNIPEFQKFWSPDWKENNKKICLENVDGGHRVFYETYDGVNTGLFPWTSEIIPKLSKKHRLAIFTNRHSARARILIKPISRYFECIIGGEDVRRLKPDPEGIFRIFSILGIGMEDRDALMIGDMPEDLIAGKAAGVKTGAVKWGLGDWDELLACGPDYVFEKYKDLLRI